MLTYFVGSDEECVAAGDGVLTDGKGRAINVKNVILVMTSNVGGRKILELVGQQKLARLERGMNNGGGEGRKKK